MSKYDDAKTYPNRHPVRHANNTGVCFLLDHCRREILVVDPAGSPGEELLAKDAEEVRVGDVPADSTHESVARIIIVSSARKRKSYPSNSLVFCGGQWAEICSLAQ